MGLRSQEVLGAIGGVLAKLPVRRAVLVRKEIGHFPDFPVWVMAISVKPRWGTLRNREAEAQVVEVLEEVLADSYDFIF